MKAQVKRRLDTPQQPAATNARNYRTFLLVAQLEAKAIGARIARARKEAGMTQDQLVDVASFSKRSLQDYEAGNTIPWAHFGEIAELTNTPVSKLMHGEPEKPPINIELVLDRLERMEALELELREIRQMLQRIEGRLPGSGGSETASQPAHPG